MKINKYRSFIFAGLLMLLILTACKMASNITYINLAGLYQPDSQPSFTGIRVFNESDSISKVFVRYNLTDFVYKIPNGKSYRKAEYSILYNLYASYDSDISIDHNVFNLSDSLYYGQEMELVFDFDVHAEYPGNYLLEITVNDLNMQTSTSYPVDLYKGSPNVAQNFLPVNRDGEIIFNDWVQSSTELQILCKDQSLDKLFMFHHEVNFDIAPPPFSMSALPSYKYDTKNKFTIKFEKGTSELIELPGKGLYHFQADTSNSFGLSLFRFDDDFPKVTESEQLIPPLRYLTTTKEYNALISAENKKQAVDNFWLETAGNEDRALELIKNYYSRVEYANWYFTSFKEGWKTDRGMTYIIFGPPQTVYRRGNIETWTYGEQGNRISLTFDFITAVNPFTDEDFVLQRQPDFKSPWYIAVDYWRR
jgi:GWxTD domain-containing protein